MGLFLVPEAISTFRLEDPPYAGAEFEARLTLSPAIYFAMAQWIGEAGAAADTMTAVREQAKIFVEHGLISWNLAYQYGPHKGEPMPISVEAFLSLGLDLTGAIVATWYGSLGRVPVPLPEALPSGPVRTTKQRSPRTASTGSSPTGASRRRSSTAKTSAAFSG